MRHWFNWLLSEPLPKYTPPFRTWYRIESSLSGLAFTYSGEYSYTSLDEAKEEMDKLILKDKYKHYRIVRY
jgi:hypothetical protein